MPKAKKIFLLHERCETWRVRFGKGRSAFCERCGKEKAWLTVAEAALVSDFSEREIFRFAEEGKIHFKEKDLSLLLVCGGSLETFCLIRKK